jgi:hypothetical protein
MARKNRTQLLPIKQGGGAGVFEVKFHVRQKSGAGSMFLGIRCLASDRTTELADGAAGFHWVAASAYTPGDTAWHTLTGYFTTDGSTAADTSPATGGATLSKPMRIHPDTRWIGICALANYDDQAGEFELSYDAIRQVGGKGDAALDPYPPLSLTHSKPSPESRNTTTTLTDDTDLKNFPLDAASLYSIEGTITVNSGATPDFKFLLQFSQAPVYLFTFVSGVDGTGALFGAYLGDLNTNAYAIPGGGANMIIRIQGTIASHATLASVMDLQWAQNNSDGSNTIVGQSSMLRLEKIVA